MAAETAASLDNAGLAFGLVIAAGLSTALGAAAVFERRIVKLASKPVLAAGLGFSGGVMLYVSFVEIFVKSQEAFAGSGKKENDAYFCATLCLFAGMLLLRLIALGVHRLDKDHEHHGPEVSAEVPPDPANLVGGSGAGGAPAVPVAPPAGDLQGAAGAAAAAEAPAALEGGGAAKGGEEAARSAQLQRMGLNTAAAIAIHNFPEGLATFVATLADPTVGATLAVAIGVHNIPEGLCVALPIYYATGSRLRGFLFAVLSGVSEPVGALIGYAIIKSTGEDMNQLVYGILFGLVAGMMIMIVVLELLPTALRYDPGDRVVTNSVVCGMLVMAASLCLFMA